VDQPAYRADGCSLISDVTCPAELDRFRTFRDDPRRVLLSHFGFRVGERFIYDYDLSDGWRHDVRVEQVLALKADRTYPACTGGRRAGPPEDCGGALGLPGAAPAPLHLRRAARLAEILENADQLDDHREDLVDLRRWLSLDRFDRRAVNRALAVDAVTGTSAA
jgi:hypothetical protein